MEVQLFSSLSSLLRQNMAMLQCGDTQAGIKLITVGTGSMLATAE